MKTLLLGAVAAALLHITPTVVLVKRQDAVTNLLPGADQFTARELHLSSADSRKLHDAVGWEPPDGVVTFYVGKHQALVTGSLIFMRVDCQHGPIELAVGYQPNGTVRAVEVTKATVEMKPWILEAAPNWQSFPLSALRRGGQGVRPTASGNPRCAADRSPRTSDPRCLCDSTCWGS